MNALREAYLEEIDRLLCKYPPQNRRAAVMPLLYLAQRLRGAIDRQSLEDIAEILEISTTDVASLAGFYTLYHEHPGGGGGGGRGRREAYRLQVCTDLPCALRGADAFLKSLCENLQIRLGETSADGLITVEAVKCLAGCDHAPLLQVQSPEGIGYHEDQTVASALELIARLREEAPPAEEGAT